MHYLKRFKVKFYINNIIIFLLFLLLSVLSGGFYLSKNISSNCTKQNFCFSSIQEELTIGSRAKKKINKKGNTFNTLFHYQKQFRHIEMKTIKQESQKDL